MQAHHTGPNLQPLSCQTLAANLPLSSLSRSTSTCFCLFVLLSAFNSFINWKHFLLEYSYFRMMYQFLLYSRVNQLYIYIYLLILRFFFHIGHYRISSGVSCAIQRVLSSYLFQGRGRSVAKQCLTFCDFMDYSWPGSSLLHYIPEFAQFMCLKLMILSNYLILCHLILLLPSVFLRIRVFSKESALCIRWPKYWSFSFSICHSNEYSGFISFRIDRFDLPAVQGTLKSLFQYYN